MHWHAPTLMFDPSFKENYINKMFYIYIMLRNIFSLCWALAFFRDPPRTSP